MNLSWPFYGICQFLKRLPASLALGAVAMPANGQFQFNIAGVTGLNYGVQVSTDLVSWIPVATNISPFIFADTNANLSSQRFYRSVYSP